MDVIDIYRAGSFFTSIKPEENSAQFKQVMGKNELQLNFKTSSYFKFEINDYCTVFGERYQFNRVPPVKESGKNLWEYNCTLDAEGADLAKIQFLFLGSNNVLKESEFALMGNSDTFIDLVLANASRIDSSWVKGEIIPTGYKNLTFKVDNCFNALSKIAEAFDTEFWIQGKTIHLVKIQNDTGVLFRYGKNKGLYDLTRLNVDNSDIVTRLYCYGSEKNIPPDYLNYSTKRLSLPAGPNNCLISSITADTVDNGDGTQTITFTFVPAADPAVTALQIEYRPTGTTDPWTNNTGSPASPRVVTIPTGSYDFVFRTIGSICGGLATLPITVSGDIVTPLLINQPLPYLEKNTSKYGVIEATEIFEDIYPNRTGKVTSVNVSNVYQFTDANIDFDVNVQLLPGISPKITFNTGQLAGYDFEISNFNNGTKTFTILKNKNERVLDVPSALLKPAIGDQYVMTDIKMPQTYIDAAEQELKSKAQGFLDKLSEPQLTYAININPVYLKRKGYNIGIGDMVWIKDVELEVEKRIRIVTTTRNIINEFQYQIDVSDEVTPGKLDRILADGKAVTGQVNVLQQTVVRRDIFNNKVIGDFKVEQGTIIFDTSLPTHAAGAGFSDLLIENATGRIFRKV